GFPSCREKARAETEAIRPLVAAGVGAARARAAEGRADPARGPDAVEPVAGDGISAALPHLWAADCRLSSGLLLPLRRPRLRHDLHHAALPHLTECREPARL